MEVGVQRDVPSADDEEQGFRVIPESESRREKLVLLKAKQRYEGVDAPEYIQVRPLSSTNIRNGLGGNSELPDDKGKFESNVKWLGDLTEVEVSSKGGGSIQDKPTTKMVGNQGFKMANVRRSSVFGAVGNKMPLHTGSESKKDVPSNQKSVEEKSIETAKQSESASLGETNPDPDTAKPSQQSSGRTGNVTRANLLALIRRRQQRRYRPPKKSTAVVLIQYFLSFLYYVGMSPIRPASAKKLPNWICRLQKVVFWLLTLTSVAQALDELKYGWIKFNTDESMLNFLTLGFYLATLLTRVYYIKLLTTSAESISCLLDAIEKTDVAGTTNESGYTMRAAIGIGFLSVVLAASTATFGAYELHNWTWKAATLERSREFSESVFIWSSGHFDEASSDLLARYGTNLTAQVKTFAAAGNFLSFAGTLHGCVLLDLWSIVAIQLFILQFHFSNALQEAKAETNPAAECPLSIHWQYYKRLRSVCDQSHDVFGKLLNMVHMQNLLLFGYFLFEIMKKEPVSVVLLIDILSVAKVAITYFLMQKSSHQNEKYEECVIECSECGLTIEMDGKIMSVGVLLKDMKRHPIGIGRRDFYVNETFVLKFVAAVGSMFMLLSGESDDKFCCNKT